MYVGGSYEDIQAIYYDNFIYFCFGKLVDDIVNLCHPLQCSLADTGDKCPVLLWQITVFVQHIANCNMGEFPVSGHREQNIHHQIPCIYFLSHHCFFLQTE